VVRPAPGELEEDSHMTADLIRAVRPLALTLAAASVAVVLAAGQSSTEAVRIAINKDADLNVVSVDDKAGTLTVLVKSTGERVVVRAADVKDGTLQIRTRGRSRSIRVVADGQAVSVTPRAGGGVTVNADGQTVTVDQRRGGVTVNADGQSVSVGSSGAAARSSRSSSRAGRTELETRGEPVVCSGGQDIRLEGVRLETATPAIVAGGGCQVTIIDSEILSDEVAITASGGASITIENSLISGRQGAATIAGTAQVAARDSELRGRINRGGAGQFLDNGNNIFR
jgi:hypothetical protein